MIFEIWKTTHTRDQAEHYSAENYQDVALEWARRYDQTTSSYSVARQVATPEICVAIAGDSLVRRFRIRGKLEPVYSASEILECEVARCLGGA